MMCNHVQENRKACRRAASARIIDVRSPLARKMVRMVVQFDLSYDQLKAQWHEPGGIDEQEGLELMENARQAVQEFLRFLEGFKERARRGGPPAAGPSMRWHNSRFPRSKNGRHRLEERQRKAD